MYTEVSTHIHKTTTKTGRLQEVAKYKCFYTKLSKDRQL